MQLSELGERNITENLLPGICEGVGDDCCYFPLGERDLVVTTDPVPVAAARIIGEDEDLYWVGRLLVTINASDLAAAGATPHVFVAAVECSPKLDSLELERFFLGVSDACKLEGLRYSGGNLKEAANFAATGTAIGSVPGGAGFHRFGAKPGNFLFSVGQGGEFWRDAFLWLGGERFSKEDSKLFAPKSQLALMRSLRPRISILSSMDNSDGLLATLQQLARSNKCRMRLNLEKLTVPKSALEPLENARLWFGWGDWNVIIAVDADTRETLLRVSQEELLPIFELGAIEEGEPGVALEFAGRTIMASRLESERFVADSWFSEGIQGYIRRLRAVEMP